MRLTSGVTWLLPACLALLERSGLHGKCICLDRPDVISGPGETLMSGDPSCLHPGKEFCRYRFGPEKHERLAQDGPIEYGPQQV